ncbi:diphosphomevalonate decarboxylase [Atopobacter phocae]|uniref:diphosphomevalonate decarboxylase n=1 Tax=Atopobacter phocae TaxID=136492 RepID=UPI000472E3B3|nr:diphosphomevalonate decarboxylase [Atopobacter phocae]
MTRKIGYARAHTNIALIKYWGKKDHELFLPMNSSLSLTLDAFYTDTQVIFDSSFAEDTLTINGELQPSDEINGLVRFLNVIREKEQTDLKAHVISHNIVPTAAGLASSASAYAALTGAIAQAFNWQLDHQALSRIARRGSGSATRSLFGGFVEWEMGVDDETSQAIPIDDAQWDIGMLVMILTRQKKDISSRVGMQHTVETSPFYTNWVETAAQDLKQMKAAIYRQDFQTVGELTEHSAMKMHATTFSANPPFFYFEPETIHAIRIIQALRKQGHHIYYTLDAGPNLKVLGKRSELESVRQALLEHYSSDQLILTQAGPGMRQLSADEWASLYPTREEDTSHDH